MIQASRGGLVKYPNAGSRDQAQYWASSKNRSTTEYFRPINRITVSAARIATARPKLGTTSDRLERWDADVIGRRNMLQASPRYKGAPRGPHVSCPPHG